MNDFFFDKILVANRGEIALRIMKTLKKMNIKSVAIYSETDTNALHVQYADEAYYIGSSPATESYLSISNIISAIRASGAQAVHPGYGFLSENPNFAAALKREGIILIGPSANAIKKMGDKIEAKKIAIAANINTVPGYIGTINKESVAIKIAKNIGFPIILKATVGGGGRGMRVVYNEDQMITAYESARAEANNSFKDSRVFIEKLIENTRHIEIQIIADQYGNVVCLGERECSIQRHHQKIIEETPSCAIDEEIRQKMYSQARALVQKVGYYSVGTVEFIVDKDLNFYFLEMNTRLQVEHPITELVTGIDLVEEMIKIAAGQRLSFSQKDVKITGWALECRICAEDPIRGFLPSSGRVTCYTEPPKNSCIRIDSGITSNSEVSMFYDAMIVKICSWGQNRKEAINLMKTALSSFVIQGISHNISFLETLINHPRFIAGDISTEFIDQEYSVGFAGAQLTSEITEIFLATATYISLREQFRASCIRNQIIDYSDKINTRWIVSIDDRHFPILVRKISDGYKIRQGGNRIYVRSNWQLGSKLFTGVINENKYNVKIENIITGYKLTHSGITVKVYVRSPRVSELESIMPKVTKKQNCNTLLAPLSGQILAIKVKVGDVVYLGQELFILVAMKMENIIVSECEGEVEQIYIKKGDQVSTGQQLLDFVCKIHDN